MLLRLILLQWKSFKRSADYSRSLVLKILSAIGYIYLAAVFAGMGILAYYYLTEEKPDENILFHVTDYFLYYWAATILARYFFQKMTVIDIKPLLILPIPKKTIIHFGLLKTIGSIFNTLPVFSLITLDILVYRNGYPFTPLLSWNILLISLILTANFLTILFNEQPKFIIGFLMLFGLVELTHYTHFIDLHQLILDTLNLFYMYPVIVIPAVFVAAITYYSAFKSYQARFWLDGKLSAGKTKNFVYDLNWLNRFGKIAAFLKVDINMIVRNIRPRKSALIGILFIFYGFIYIDQLTTISSPVRHVTLAIVMTSGFIFNIGQFIPSWDSQYYPLLMTQSIRYMDYLRSKWWLMTISSLLALMLGTVYLFFSMNLFLTLIAATIYNIGINVYLVLWSGAYQKRQIDLNSSNRAFGNNQGFNGKVFMISLPKIILPTLLFLAGEYFPGKNAGNLTLAVTGIAGLLFRNRVFHAIERIYKQEKYDTLAAFKQKNI